MGVKLPVTEFSGDYRVIDDMMVPFKSTANQMAMGHIVARIREVKFDVAVPDAALGAQAK